MANKAALLDYIFSLTLFEKPLEKQKGYQEIKKVADPAYLNLVADYQKQLMQEYSKLEYFITSEYNILYYLVLQQKEMNSFEKLLTSVEKLSAEEAFQFVALYLIEKDSFSIPSLIEVSLSSINKWRLTALFYDFERLKAEFLMILSQTWKAYQNAREELFARLADKVANEQKRLEEKGEELYQIVFADYISRVDFEEVTTSYLLPLSFHRVLFTQQKSERFIALSLYDYDYYRLLKDEQGYDVVFREQVLKTLADPTRFGILKFINEGIWSNKVIAQRFSISSAAVSYQLKYLLEQDLILFDKKNRKYSVNKPLLNQVFKGIHQELELSFSKKS